MTRDGISAALGAAPYGPLAGLKVLELGQLIAGPYSTRLMAEFGADVTKVEPPNGGDPLRGWRIMEGGTSLWWYVQSRNKRSVTLDLRHPKGQDLVCRLITKMDVLVENFRPGTLEKWHLSPEKLLSINPRLIIVRISGFGQTGPYRDRPGFGSVGESMGGLRHVTGYPDRAPVRSNLSIGDSIAALFAAYGTMMAVYDRDVRGTGEGQVVDVSLYESVMALMEGTIPEYDRTGIVRGRHGNTVPGITPQGTYPCLEGQYVVIGGNGDAIFKRLMRAIGRNDLADDPRFATNAGRAQEEAFLDQVIAEWTAQHTVEQVLSVLEAAEVPSGRIYTASDMVADPHILARQMIGEVDVPGVGPIKFPGIVPKLSRTPGATRWPGVALGAHNREVYVDWLGMSESELMELQQEGVI